MSGETLKMEKKRAANKGYNRLTRSWPIWLYSTVALLSSCILIIFWFTNIFQDALDAELKLRNGTSTFGWWLYPPVRPTQRVYIFNYTNIDAFERGEDAKLRVQEVGPYVYRETLRRMNPKIHENGTVTFQEMKTYQWVSGSPENEKIIVPNVPLLGALAYSRNMNFMAKVGLTAIFSSMRVRTFIELEAGEFMWGYDDKIYQMGKPFMPAQQTTAEKFGMLAFRNGLSHDQITIHTGENDINKLGVIENLNGRKSTDIWGDEECDRIVGTDGSVFPPRLMRNQSEELLVYAKDMCRPIRFKYDAPNEANGIPSYRYKLPPDALTCTQEKDSCYCLKTSKYSSEDSRVCPPPGIFNISACNFGSPFLTSFPHFYGADESVLSQFDGLDPQQDKHETYLDIHQRLSVPIGGHSRFQVNVEVRKASGVPFEGSLNDGAILPLLWIEIGIDGIPDKIDSILRTAHFTANAVEASFKWGSILALLLSSGALYFALKRKDEEVTKKTVDV